MTIACVSVNDAFVMERLGKAGNADGKVTMLADGNGDFTKAIGLDFDGSGFGLGHALAALLDAGRGRRRRGAQHRGEPGRHARSPAPTRSWPPSDRVNRCRGGASAVHPGSPALPLRARRQASRASSSARSFSASPAWPRDPVPLDVVARRRSSRSHRSPFFTGFFSAVRQPRAFQPGSHWVMPLRRYCAVGVQHRRGRAASAPPAPRSPPSAPCGCWWSRARRRTARARVAPSAGSPPSRPGRDCRCRRHRSRSRRSGVGVSRGHRPAARCDVAVEAQLAQIFQRVLAASPARPSAWCSQS